MTFEYWAPVPPHTGLAALLDTAVLIYRPGRADGVVATVAYDAEVGQHKVTWASTTNLSSTTFVTHGRSAEIHVVAEKLIRAPSPRVVAIPPVRWPRLGAGRPMRLPVSIITGVAMFLATLALGGPGWAAAALPVAIASFAMLWATLREKEPTQIPMAGDLVLDGTNIVEYAERRALGERPELRTMAEQRDAVLARAEAIREHYESLLTDIAYRIENSALFDDAEPATQRFHMSLIAVEDAPADASVAELDDLVTEFEIAFAIARDNAEAKGLSHLPSTARDDARRAAKAVHLAAKAGTEGERVASLTQASRILASLALYCLPTISPERGEITDGSAGAPLGQGGAEGTQPGQAGLPPE